MTPAPEQDVAALVFSYRNWRGETAIRQARPLSVRFGSTEWHPEPQWLLLAFDIDKGAEREFAIADMASIEAATALSTLAAERDAAAQHERERIIAVLFHEAEVTPCEEDAKVVRGCAELVRSDFSYEAVEQYEDALTTSETRATTLAADNGALVMQAALAEQRAVKAEIARDLVLYDPKTESGKLCRELEQRAVDAEARAAARGVELHQFKAIMGKCAVLVAGVERDRDEARAQLARAREALAKAAGRIEFWSRNVSDPDAIALVKGYAVETQEALRSLPAPADGRGD